MKFVKIILPVIALSLIIFFVINSLGKTYTITFNTDGGTQFEKQEVKKSGKIEKPSAPTKEGYVFLYWELDGVEYNFDTEIKKDLNLVAKYKEVVSVKYTVTFNSNGGSNFAGQEIKEGQRVTNPGIPAYEGYKFLYWELDGVEYNFTNSVTKNITLTAKWEKDETKPVGGDEEKTKYTVTFNSDGGSDVVTQNVTEGNKATTPTKPTKKGYTFKGWYLNNIEYDFNSPITSNVELIAKWEKEVVVKYTVTFDSNGGSAVSSQSVISGNKATVPTKPTRSGYTFKGWYLNTVSYNFNNSVTKNITLVAKWQKVVVVTDVYTVETQVYQAGSPQSKIIVKKNGVVVAASEVLTSGGAVIGDNNNESGAILIDTSEFNNIAKVKLASGTIVNISK